MIWKRREQVALAVVLLVAIASPSHAVDADAWHTGAQLQRQLDSPVGITWSGQSLRQALQRIGDTYHVACFLDRRIDPSRRVDLEVRDTPLRELIETLAIDHKLETVWVGPVVYLGPPSSAARLKALIARRESEVRVLPAARRRQMGKQRAQAWETLATPRELAQRVASEYGLTLANPDRIPHDLWPAASLPPLSAVQQLSLLSIGFDLTFTIDPAGARIDWVPIPHEVASVDPHAKGSQQPSATPRATSKNGSRRTSRSNPETKGPKVYTLRTKSPLQRLLEVLSRQAGFRLELDSGLIAKAGIDLDQIVSIDVKEVSLNELLSAALHDTGLAFEQDGDVVHVVPE